MAERRVDPEKSYHLEACPLCGGKSRIEYVGEWCNAVCQKCGCSSGSYRNPAWAAKRWNTRVGNIPKDDKTGTFDVLFIQDSKQLTEPRSAPVSFKPYKGGKKQIVDLPGQMLFDFCSSSDSGVSNG